MRLAKGRMALVAALVGSVLAVLIVSVPALAQSRGMLVKVPFDFRIKDMKLPSGTYSVYLQGDAIRIVDIRGHGSFILSNAVPNPAATGDSALVFNRYGDSYFLSEVRWNGYRNGRGLPKSSSEIELAKTMTATGVLTAGLPLSGVPPSQ